jgi:murein DD-endopeptidase MepM/ murein hydrolase activator NlpD
MNLISAYAHLMLITLLILLSSACSRGPNESPVEFEEKSTRHTENMTPQEWEAFKNKAIESIIRKYAGESKITSGKIQVIELPASSEPLVTQSKPVLEQPTVVQPTEKPNALKIPETLAPSSLPSMKALPAKSEQKTQEKVERYSQLKIKPEETKGKQYKVPPNALTQANNETAAPTQPLAATYAWPTKGTVSKAFGKASDGITNNGINIKAKAGNPVVAIDSGKVIFVGAIKGMGKVVLIEHPNQMIAAYAQVGEISVRPNDMVKKNQRIAEILGTEGTEGELHFELRKGTKSINPMDYLK